MTARRVAAGLVLLALGFAGGVGFAAVSDKPWHSLTGDDWRGMSPPERTAFLNGYLSASGLADAETAGAADSLALMKMLPQLRRDGRLRYPYSPSVYDARISDHYVWENHRPQPIWYGLREVNSQLRASVAGDSTRH